MPAKAQRVKSAAAGARDASIAHAQLHCGQCDEPTESERPCASCGRMLNLDVTDPAATPTRRRDCLFGTVKQYSWLRDRHPDILQQVKRKATQLDWGRAGIEDVLAEMGYRRRVCPRPCGDAFGVAGLPCSTCGAVSGELAPRTFFDRDRPYLERLVRPVLWLFYAYAVPPWLFGLARWSLSLLADHYVAAVASLLAAALALRLVVPKAFGLPPEMIPVLFVAGACVGFSLAASLLSSVGFGVLLLAAGISAGYVSLTLLLVALGGSFVLNFALDVQSC